MSSQNIDPIPKESVLAIHEDQMRRHGGLPGVRDDDLLESALAQPFAAFGGQELYPSLAQKAARYGFGIIKNHPFADGNKRTGAALIIAFLRANGIAFKPRSDDFYATIMATADGSMGFDELTAWIERQIEP